MLVIFELDVQTTGRQSKFIKINEIKNRSLNVLLTQFIFLLYLLSYKFDICKLGSSEPPNVTSANSRASTNNKLYLTKYSYLK